MKTYLSTIPGHGRVVILETLEQAIEAGRAFIHEKRRDFLANASAKYGTIRQKRDGTQRKGTTTGAQLAAKYNATAQSFENAVTEIRSGVKSIDPSAVLALAERIRAAVLEIEPSLAKQGGMVRADDGDEFLWELAEAGEEACFLAPSKQDEVAATQGDGAFRIVINTDVAWWGHPTDNAAVMSALLLVLMEWGQCEVWIQQGWIRHDCDKSGVTLFKLEYSGAFDPNALGFWIGSIHKDSPFSWAVNKALGRVGANVATRCETPCDLWLNGPWATHAGLTGGDKVALASDPAKLVAFAAKWIASTAVKMIRGEQAAALGC